MTVCGPVPLRARAFTMRFPVMGAAGAVREDFLRNFLVCLRSRPARALDAHGGGGGMPSLVGSMATGAGTARTGAFGVSGDRGSSTSSNGASSSSGVGGRPNTAA